MEQSQISNKVNKRKWANVLITLALLLQLLLMFVPNLREYWILIIVLLVLNVSGCYFFCRSKGLNVIFSLLGLIGFIGVIIIFILPGKSYKQVKE